MRNKRGFTLVEIMIVVAIIGLLAAIAIPSFVKARAESQSKACINNLRIMDSAKEQAAMAAGWADATAVGTGTAEETNVLSYVKGNATPTCPANGTYAWNAIGVDPSCTLEAAGSHTL